MKFEFKQAEIQTITPGDILMTDTEDIYMVVEDSYCDYALLSLKSFAIHEDYNDYSYIDQLIRDFQNDNTITRIIKHDNLVLKEEKKDDWI